VYYKITQSHFSKLQWGATGSYIAICHLRLSSKQLNVLLLLSPSLCKKNFTNIVWPCYEVGEIKNQRDACLACMKPWVQSLALKLKKKKKE
jgi:hypothetical protein